MASAFLIIALAALAGAVVSWGVAVVSARHALAARKRAHHANGIGLRVLLLVWPFAVRRRRDDDSVDAVRSSKAVIAFFVCLTVAVAATSAYTNLTHKPATAGPQGSVPAGGAAPIKS
ncbi:MULTISPECIES: hypothetical protein [unclassified Xanthobacter]|uniref:hypothetical protein n=1 Tax=unclassified Xanthobacter TaxID=2623496 RepID=UPI001EDF44A9|nr:MULTISPECIES: hypothetical protein [unclassified Xanthobacter]